MSPSSSSPSSSCTYSYSCLSTSHCSSYSTSSISPYFLPTYSSLALASEPEDPNNPMHLCFDTDYLRLFAVKFWNNGEKVKMIGGGKVLLLLLLLLFLLLLLLLFLVSGVSGLFPLWGDGVPTPISTGTLLESRCRSMHRYVWLHTITHSLSIPFCINTMLPWVRREGRLKWCNNNDFICVHIYGETNVV